MIMYVEYGMLQTRDKMLMVPGRSRGICSQLLTGIFGFVRLDEDVKRTHLW